MEGEREEMEREGGEGREEANWDGEGRSEEDATGTRASFQEQGTLDSAAKNTLCSCRGP